MKGIAGRMMESIKGMLPDKARLYASRAKGYMREGVEANRRVTADRMARRGADHDKMAQSIFNPAAAKDIGNEIKQIQKGAQAMGEVGMPGENVFRVAGAAGDRIIQDVMNDGTRQPYWRYNNPVPIGESAANYVMGREAYQNKKFIGKGGTDPKNPGGPPVKGFPSYAAAAMAAPVVGHFVTAGHFDPASFVENPDELGRPKGFKQQFTEKGGPYTKTNMPGQEAFERVVFNRRGRPLKYEDAKAELPDLTPQQYGDFMRYRYQDRGIGGLGLVKGTRRNLQGDPELSIVGFPVTPASAGSFVGAGLGMRIAGTNPALRGRPGALLASSVAGTAVGALAGYGLGRLMNMDLARQGRPDPMTTQEYSQSQGL